jgi:Gp157 protein
MKSLFGKNSLSDDLLKLEILLTDQGGEITDDDAGRALEEYLNQVNQDVEQKVDGICCLIKELEARADARKTIAKDISALAATDYNVADRLHKRLKLFFEVHKITKIEAPRSKAWIQGNGGKFPLNVPPEWENDPASAPEQFHRHKIELDKEGIHAALSEFNEKLDAAAKKCETPEEYAEVLGAMAESPEFRQLRDSVKGCSFGSRGTSLRIK